MIYALAAIPDDGSAPIPTWFIVLTIAVCIAAYVLIARHDRRQK
jgi:hypothetical protein